MADNFVRTVIERAALVSAFRATPAFLRRVERLRLLSPIGRTARRELFYPAEVLERLSHVQSLLAAGYAEKDIGHVLGRVLAEGQGEPESVCTASELPVPRAVVESLVARGSLSVWGLTTDGERLFAATEFDRVRVLHALEELGLASFQTSLDAPGQDLVSEVQRLESQLDVVRGWLARVLGKRRKARAPANDKPTKPKSVGLFSRRKRNADREG